MRLPNSEHTARPWRIHDIAPDFRIEDVWAYRTPGAGPDDFPDMLDALRAAGGLSENPALVRFLFAARWKLGALFGWDRPQQGLVGRVDTLCDRLPPDLRQDVAGDRVPHTPFTMVYELPDEAAIELANKTVHDICHLGWVRTDDGEYELRMAALVKPNGRFGRIYLAAIKPIRYLIVYPALTRKWERAWRNRHRYRPGATPAPPDVRRHPLITWGGRLIVFYGAAHTLGALVAEGAVRYAPTWFSGRLWAEDLAAMTPAMSAYWLSVSSFGPPMILLGLTVLWLDRRGITPPSFLGWALGAWTVLDTAVAGPGMGQNLILLVGSGLLVAGGRRAADRARSADGGVEDADRRSGQPGEGVLYRPGVGDPQ